MIPTPKDMFEAWLAEPLGRECEDPRFDVRRARPEEFERIWDVVDAAFGTQRPRAAYEWMYRANPTGLARCWILEERASGRILKTGAEYPWPIWYGDRVERGLLAGDAATLPEWQRKGLSALRRTVRRSHPWYPTFCTIAGPNEGSRVVSAKAGDADSLTGDLPGGVAVLRASGVLERVGAPGPVAAV
ncbi:MAG: hypothetical protein KC616_20235, partial [Myxococcales bacterium]|nr:hypothetical protein [Myxococcales bacterium]